MMAELVTFHFAKPWWLLALAVPPFVWLWLALTRRRASRGRLERYADPHLLPHLLGRTQGSGGVRPRRMALWTVIWAMLVLALAGPRWDYTKSPFPRPVTNLMVLLDLSQSMAVEDVQPSRLSRARQEIADLLSARQPIRIGLMAFASVPHVIAPATQDRTKLRQVLPALSTDLAEHRGSRLAPALDRVEQLFSGLDPEAKRAVLLISDGGFPASDLQQRVKGMIAQGIHLHVLGVGTPRGGAVRAPDGQLLNDASGRTVVSSLEEERLKGLASAGGGTYQRATFRDADTQAVLNAVAAQVGQGTQEGPGMRIWNERFYLLLVPAALLLLPWFRRRRVRAYGQAGQEA